MNRHEEIPVLPEPSPWRRWWAAPLAVALAGIAAAGLLWGYRIVADRLHDPKIDYLSQKLELARRSTADVVFVGTSVVYRNIDTGELNRRAAASGCDLDFLNLGLPAMSVAEFKLMIDSIGQDGPAPRQIVFQPQLYDGLTRVDSRRSSYGNRLDALDVALASLDARSTTARIASLPSHEGDSLEARLAFARHWALSSLRAGEAAHWLLRDEPSRYDAEMGRLHRRGAGHVSLEEDPHRQGRSQVRQRFLRDLATWRERAESARARARASREQSLSKELPEGDRRLHERLLAIAGSPGAEPMVIFPPMTAYSPPLVDFYRRRLGEHGVLDFAFDRFPEFLDDRLWHDNAHLNRDGSRLLSERLLPRFCGPG